MSTQGKRQEITNDSASGQDIDQDQKKNVAKKQVSKNKRGLSNGPNNKNMDIWQRNEMEKHRKMMEQNQKRMKENTLKEKNEQEKAEREQQEILEKLKKDKKEQYEKYLKTNIRQNDLNYQKQKPVTNVYKNIDIINGIDNSKQSEEGQQQANDNKKGLKQWVPRPVPLEDAEKHLKQQKIEQELYENQMKQMELVQLLEEKKMLDMYKNLPKPINQKRNQYENQENINEDDEQNGSFSGIGESNLYVDSENESQLRKKMKKNEQSQLNMKQSEKNKNKQDYNYNQEISVVQNNYDLYGDRSKTPDMLGFEVYNQNYKANLQNEQNAKKKLENEKNKDKQNKKENSPLQNKPQKKETNFKKLQDNSKSDNYGEWKFEEDNNLDKKLKNDQFVQKVLPNGMTNHHKEVILSKDFQKIKFELDDNIQEEDDEQEQDYYEEEEKYKQEIKNEKLKVFQNKENKPSSSQSRIKNYVQDKQNNQSDIKKQLEQKEMELLKEKQEQLIRQKKEQKQKEQEMEKQKQQYLQQYYKQDQKDQNQQEKDQILKEFKNQFNDLKKQYNQFRQITNSTSKSNLQTASKENNTESDRQNKIDNKKNQRYEPKVQNKTPQSEQDEFLEQADFDNDFLSKQSQMNNSKVVRRTNYLKDVSKFSMKSQPPTEKPSYSKHQKERRKFWERKTNEDFLNQSIEEKATLTAISKFKSKLQNNINIDKQLNNEEQSNISPEKAEKQRELEEWQKINDQEVKLQREILKIHMDNLDKVKDVEEKNQINTSQNNISQMLENKSKSRINTATTNKSSATQKTTRTNKTTTHKDNIGHKNAKNQINPISEIENEDDLEASLMNLDNQLSNQKNRITLMTAEIEQSLKPKNPQLRKDILNNPSMLQQNPFTVDITSQDKEYLEEEKQKFFTPIQSNHKQSKLNISHISSVSNQKELVSNRPISNKTSITNNQFNSLAVIPPHFSQQQNLNSQSHSNFQDKLPKINQNLQSIEPLQDKSRIEIQKQNSIANSQIQRSKNQSRQSSNQSSIVTVPISKNPNELLNNNVTQKKNIDSKDKVQQNKNKEIELRKKFPEFFSDEDQQEVTPKIKQKNKNYEQFQANSPKQIDENQDKQSVQQTEDATSSKSNRQESSKQLKKKKTPLQDLPQLNPQVIEQDKEDIYQWWKSLQKSIEKSNENTPSQKLSENKTPSQVLGEEKQVKIQSKQIKNVEDKQKRDLDDQQKRELEDKQKRDQERQQQAKILNQQVETQKYQQVYEEHKIKKEILQQQNKQDQVSKDQQSPMSKEQRKKMIMKKFLEDVDENEQNDTEDRKKQKSNVDLEKNNENENLKQQNQQNKKKLIEVQFEQYNVEPKRNKRVKNNDGIEINESEIMSDNLSVVSRNIGDESAKNNRKQNRNYSGKNQSSENLSKIKESKSRQRSADSSHTNDSRNKIINQLREQQHSNSASPINPSKKRVEKVLDKNVIAKVELQQQQIEQAIKQTLEKLEQAEFDQIQKEQEKQKVNITKRKSNVSSNNSNVEKELSDISHNYSFAESDFSHITGNGNYATRQIIKKNYVVTGKVPSRYNHDNLYPSKNKSNNNSFIDSASNMSSSKFVFQKENIQDSKLQAVSQSNIQSKAVIPENKDIIDEEEYQGDIKINRNVNLQKLLFVD